MEGRKGGREGERGTEGNAASTNVEKREIVKVFAAFALLFNKNKLPLVAGLVGWFLRRRGAHVAQGRTTSHVLVS